MASATPGPQFPNGLTWEIITPQRARAALLRRSIPTVEQPISATPRRQPHLAQTPSSPTNRISAAAAAEGTHHATSDTLPAPQGEDQLISVVEAATRLAQEYTETYNTKLTVFRAFCAAFEETARQFTTKPEREFAQNFATSFLDFWNQALTAPKPTYSSVAAGPTTNTCFPAPATVAHHHQQPKQQQQNFPRPQGQQNPAAPPVCPVEDLRVFIRLGAEAQARSQTSYAIRTHIAQKTGLNPQSIHAIPVASGWAIRPTDAATRDRLLQQKDEWSHELGATTIETSQKWYKYVVPNCPRRLTDLQGNEVDYDSAARDEIKCQTGLEPVSVQPSRHDSEELPSKTLIVSFTEPTKRFWTLFGVSSPAKLINKPQAPRQCTICWDYHSQRGCRRLPICKSCGKSAHGGGSLQNADTVHQLPSTTLTRGRRNGQVPGVPEASARNSGHEKKWTPRFARRGASNAANGDAPDSVCDQMMRHDPQFATFYHAYLNEIANFDMQNAFLEEEKESQLFGLFAHVSLTRDPRATADMVPEEAWANLAPDPEIIELEEERARLKQGRYRIEGHPDEQRIRQLTNEIRTKRAQRGRQVVKARGEEEEEYVEPTIDLSVPKRAQLAEILCHQPDVLTDDAILQRRIQVIDLMVTLCDKRETVKRDRIQRQVTGSAPIKIEPAEPDKGLGSDLFPLLMQGTQCPDCIGDERLSPQERAFLYCRPTVMNDHFDNQHLLGREQAG
ncbi:hypothetical protein S40293_10099 [Stachybotrys chartarum IBT 40293]|nr:hypothetical protein S40293_10099 [Stachybotrys chartarum IBT 40293]